MKFVTYASGDYSTLMINKFNILINHCEVSCE